MNKPFWPSRVGKPSLAEQLTSRLRIHADTLTSAYNVFAKSGAKVGGFATIEAALECSHQLPPGNVVIRKDGAVLSVGVPYAPIETNTQPGRVWEYSGSW